jgi:hypothetical protein
MDILEFFANFSWTVCRSPEKATLCKFPITDEELDVHLSVQSGACFTVTGTWEDGMVFEFFENSKRTSNLTPRKLCTEIYDSFASEVSRDGILDVAAIYKDTNIESARRGFERIARKFEDGKSVTVLDFLVTSDVNDTDCTGWIVMENGIEYREKHNEYRINLTVGVDSGVDSVNPETRTPDFELANKIRKMVAL